MQVDHRFGLLPDRAGVVQRKAFDEHGARMGVKDDGELRVQAGAGGTSSAHRSRAVFELEAHWRFEFVPIGTAHASSARRYRRDQYLASASCEVMLVGLTGACTGPVRDQSVDGRERELGC